MNIEPSLGVCGILHCMWRTFETKYAGKPRVGFHITNEAPAQCIKNYTLLALVDNILISRKPVNEISPCMVWPTSRNCPSQKYFSVTEEIEYEHDNS